MQAPKTISVQWICILTHYDKMSNEDRQIVFDAYRFEKSKDIYILTKPELLIKDIIKKLLL